MSSDNIAVFTKNKIFLYLPHNPKYKNVTYYCDYSPDLIHGIIEKLRKDLGISHLGVIFNNEVSYTAAIQVPPVQKNEDIRSVISAHIPEKIPEITDNLVWDYKIVKTSNPENVQITGVNKTLVETLVNSFQKLKISIKFIEPLCYSFTKIDKAPSKYIVLYSSEYENVILYIHDGVVAYTQNLLENADATISRFIDFVRAKYGIDANTSFYKTDDKNLLSSDNAKIFQDLGVKNIDKNLHQVVFAVPDDVKIKKDESSLNLNPSSVAETGILSKFHLIKNGSKKKDENRKGKSHRQLILIIAFCLLFLGMIGFVAKYIFDNNLLGGSKNNPTSSQVENTSSNQTIEPTTSPTPSPSIEAKPTVLENFKGYKVEILNGSGIRGEADKVKALIESLEFDEVSTGNADSYNYQETEVYFKSNDLYGGIEVLDASINTYSLIFSETLLPEDYPYDVKIIVGKLKTGIEVEE